MRQRKWPANLETENVPVVDKEAARLNAITQTGRRARDIEQGKFTARSNEDAVEAWKRVKSSTQMQLPAPHQRKVAHLLVMDIEAVTLRYE
jgi:hypothetical protein